MDEEYLCEVISNDEPYYLLTRWLDSGSVEVDLSDGEYGWQGEVTEREMKASCQKLKMNYKEFISQTKKALTRENVGGLNFKYDIQREKGDESIKMVWKKFIPTDKIKIQLGEVALGQVDPSEVSKAIFKHSIAAGSKYQEKITALKSDNERLVAERASALKRLEKYVTVKEDLEKDLYSKFVLIINEKKGKIRGLREELEHARAGVPDTEDSVQPSTSGTGGERGRGKVKEEVEEDAEEDIEKKATDSEYETDKEDDAQTPPAKKSRGGGGKGRGGGRRSVSIKQEVVDTVDELLDDMMDDGDDVKVEPPAKRGRVRGRRGAPKTTPSKPVMPKVPSGDTPIQQTTSRSRRTPLRKTPSDASNKSSDNLDDLVSQI